MACLAYMMYGISPHVSTFFISTDGELREMRDHKGKEISYKSSLNAITTAHRDIWSPSGSEQKNETKTKWKEKWKKKSVRNSCHPFPGPRKGLGETKANFIAGKTDILPDQVIVAAQLQGPNSTCIVCCRPVNSHVIFS